MSSRDVPRGAGCCAISSSGRWKSKSETFMAAGPPNVLRYNRAANRSMSEPEPNHVLPSKKTAGEPTIAVSSGNGLAPVLDVRNLALTVVAVLAVVLVLQYAQSVLIPIVIGTLISYGL